MISIPNDILAYYEKIKPQIGYVYHFLDENLSRVSRDELKIGVGFYRTEWIDGAFLFEADSYFLKSLKEFLAAEHLRGGAFPVWAEWTDYYSRVWAAVGLCRFMGTGSFYLTGHGPTIILRKMLDDIPGPGEIGVLNIDGQEIPEKPEGYLVYRDPGGGAHLRNWKLFYIVLTELLSKTGVYDMDEEYIQAMAGADPSSRFVIKRDEEIYGFPSLYRVEELSKSEMAKLVTDKALPLDYWVESEAQFDGGGFTEEFKAYYKFMMDTYTTDDDLPVSLSILQHGITWLRDVLPEEIRESYTARYYALTEKYSRDDSKKELVMNWLDKITKT